MLILNFYEQLGQYSEGLKQMWERFQEIQPGIADIHFAPLLHGIVVNQLIRFPVALFAGCDIRRFADALPVSKKLTDQEFQMVVLGEHALAEFEFIERVSLLYLERFSELAHRVMVKEEVLKYFQKKMAIALYPNISNIQELEDFMYQSLVDEKIRLHQNNSLKLNAAEPFTDEAANGFQGIRERIRGLYRSVSKLCAEIHAAPEGDHLYPELHQIFLNANSIYIASTPDFPETFLQYQRMLLLLSKVIVFRKINGLAVADSIPVLVSDRPDSGFSASKDDNTALRTGLESILVVHRLRSFTDYKLKFIVDEDLTGIHKHFLQQQLDYMDQQILELQGDISEILKMKSAGSIVNTDKKPDYL